MNDVFNIADLFFKAAEKQPDKTAIIFKNKKISFCELEKQVIETAGYFIKKGITKGDNVFVMLPMSVNLYRTVLALFKIGATAVFIDEWVSIKRLQECCKVVNCKAMIGVLKVRILSWFLHELRKIPVKAGLRFSKSNIDKAFPLTKKEDTALITFTTGTTGIPKAAKRTHEFLYYQFNALIKIIKPGANDIDMPVLPIVLLINLGTGNTSIIANFKAGKPHLLQPKKIIKQFNNFSINRVTASPFFIEKIACYLVNHHHSVNSIKNIFTGGAPVFPKQAELFLKAFGAANIEIIYGSTEAEPISLINAKNLQTQKNNIQHKGLPVGKPDGNIEVRIIKNINENIIGDSEKELSVITLPLNETGEIIVKGKHVLTQYFNNEAALKRNKIFIGNDCWHRTGDCGYLDKTGDLYLTGRCNTLIKINNQYLSPFIYENYFQNMTGVRNGTIIMHNNKLTAVIELKNKPQKESVKKLIKECNAELEAIIFIKKIPMDPRHNSKIDYENLKKQMLR